MAVTNLSRPKPVKFSITLGTNPGPVAFQVWNVTKDETIKTDKEGNQLITSVTGKGLFDASYFTTWATGDKLIISFSGKSYGSVTLTLTSATAGSQTISAKSPTTTALPFINM